MVSIYKVGGLSIQGRSTVVNTHVLRVTPVPPSFHKRICSLITNFITYKIFPPVLYDILTLPKFIDGLRILDSRLQQQAMQIRWLSSFFTPCSSIFLSYFLSHFLISNSHCLDLLFSSSRTSTPPFHAYNIHFVFVHR